MFVIDSGASFHMHPHRADLINVRPCADSIVGIDRRSHACPHIGDLPLLARASDGGYIKVVLSNVRHAPTLHDTLLSVERLWRDDGISARFQDDCALELPSGRTIQMTRSQGLFLWADPSGPRLTSVLPPAPCLRPASPQRHAPLLPPPSAPPAATAAGGSLGRGSGSAATARWQSMHVK